MMEMRASTVRLATCVSLGLAFVAPAVAQDRDSVRASLGEAFAPNASLLRPGAPAPTFDFRVPAGDGLGLGDLSASGSPPTAQDQDVTFCCTERKLGMVGIEFGMVLVIPWFFNRHVTDDSTAIIGPDTWKANILEGMEWDHDNFTTNMFSHPFHGSLYFNAARSNGYNFWESSAFAWGGSFLWEMFGENNPGAANDWIATAVGGIGLGEVLWRSASITWDNQVTGFGRTLRELGGFLLSPMGSASRLFRGEWSKVGANPEGRIPDTIKTRISTGGRWVARDGVDSVFASSFFTLDVAYGDPFRDFAKPFDSFQLSAQFNGSTEKTGLGRLQTAGVLFGTPLGEQGGKNEHVFHITQHFDYVNNFTLETGGSSVAAEFRSKFGLSDRWGISTKIAPTALLLWGTDSEYADFTLRDYDFGTGAAMVLNAGLLRDGNDLFELGYHFIWQRNINGALGDHILQFLTARASWAFWNGVGVGAEYLLYTRDSFYREFPDVFRRNSQARLYAMWYIN